MNISTYLFQTYHPFQNSFRFDQPSLHHGMSGATSDGCHCTPGTPGCYDDLGMLPSGSQDRHSRWLEMKQHSQHLPAAAAVCSTMKSCSTSSTVPSTSSSSSSSSSSGGSSSGSSSSSSSSSSGSSGSSSSSSSEQVALTDERVQLEVYKWQLTTTDGRMFSCHAARDSSIIRSM